MQPMTTRTRRSSDLGGLILGQRLRTLLGPLYLGRGRRTSRGGFVLQPSPRAPAWVPRADWRVSVTSSAADSCVAVEVESFPADCSPEVAGEELQKMLANANAAARAALAPGRVRATMRHLTGSYAERVRAVRAWRMRRAARWARRALPRVGAAAAVLLALVGFVALAPRLRPAQPPSVDGTGGGGMVGGFVLASTDADEVLLARELPREPFPGQKVKRCDPDAAEVSINGGCWVSTDRRAPCGDKLYEHDGKCYRPAGKPQETPRSISR